MSFQERNIISYIVTGIIVMSVYSFHLHGLFNQGLLTGPDAGVEIGWSALKLIGGSIIFTIIVTIVISVLTNQTDMDEGDERDKQIDLLGVKVGFISFSIFFVGIFISLAMEIFTTNMALIYFIYAMWLSSIFEAVARLYIYRRGF